MGAWSCCVRHGDYGDDAAVTLARWAHAVSGAAPRKRTMAEPSSVSGWYFQVASGMLLLPLPLLAMPPLPPGTGRPAAAAAAAGVSGRAALRPLARGDKRAATPPVVKLPPL